MTQNKKNFTYIISSIIILCILYISGLYESINIIMMINLYSIIFYTIHVIWKSTRKKKYLDFFEFYNYFIYTISIGIYSIILILLIFIYYNNFISPAKIPQYTLSDGQKTIIFQGMSHIGSENFYNQIKQEINNVKKTGGVLFYEGVKQGSKESNEKFNQAIGIDFNQDLYKNMSKLYGITYQENDIFLGIQNNLDYNIDLSIDEIIKLYDKKAQESKIQNSNNNNKEIIDINKEMINTLNQFNNKELSIIIYINKALLNLIIKNNAKLQPLILDIGNKNLLDIILNERNKNLASEIIKSKYDKIIVTYGLLHFDGVYNLLKENDSNWKIKNIKYFYPIK
ncbi:MAG: hypothetical protein PHN31_00165 [Candidatus Gracilibacteria bacterium]|nr:hypothetical protein [Candidatus Gracilibacteria bacterium]